MDPNDKKEPLGKRLRDLINPALEDSRKAGIQNEILDKYFAQLAEALPQVFESQLSQFSSQVDNETQRKPRMRHPMIIDALTRAAQNGESKYSPILRSAIPVSTAFTNYSADEIKELAGYVKLHTVLRDMDIAVKILNLTADEAKSGSGLSQPIIIIDGSKSYSEGALENASLYPILPEPKPEFEKKGGKEFKL